MASVVRKQMISAAVNEGVKTATSDTPSWLNEEGNSNAASKSTQPPPPPRSAPPPPPPQSSASTANPAFDPEAGRTAALLPDSASEFVCEKDILDQMRKYHLALRASYVVATVFMAVAAVLCLEESPDAGQVFMSGYVFFFAVLICCFEFALNAVSRMIAMNFGFLYSLTGRITFLLFVGFMCFSLGTWGIVAMCVLYLVGSFQFYIMFKFPRFEEYLRKKHYYEGRNANNK